MPILTFILAMIFYLCSLHKLQTRRIYMEKLILDGKVISEEIRAELKKRLSY